MTPGTSSRYRRFSLWLAFVAVHLLVIASGWTAPNQAMGDTYLVYEPWSRDALGGGSVVGVGADWVYPPLALVPMIFAYALTWIAEYAMAWAIVVTICNAVGFAVLVGRGTSVPRAWAAIFWLVFLLAHGPVGMYRIDAITVPLVIVAALFIVSRPRVASILLAIGAWVKVWPGVIWLAALAVRRGHRLALIVPAGILSAVIVVFGATLGGGMHTLSFLSQQTGRGLQVEAVGALPFLWSALAGGDAVVYYDSGILTYQVQGQGVDAVSSALTPLLVLVTIALTGLGVWLSSNRVPLRRVLPPLMLVLVLGLIVFNKVGSPQFEVWLLAPIAYWIVLDRRAARPYAVAAILVAGLTQLVYPTLYGGILTPEPFAVTVITVRSLIMVVMMIALIVRLVALVPRGAERGRAATRLPSAIDADAGTDADTDADDVEGRQAVAGVTAVGIDGSTRSAANPESLDASEGKP